MPQSLVDAKLIAGTCKEHYENTVDSFLLVSSDSDYWGLISTLEKARFLVMVEYNKFGLTRANLTEAEQKQFYNKYIKPMHLKIEENGDVTILLRD